MLKTLKKLFRRRRSHKCFYRLVDQGLVVYWFRCVEGEDACGQIQAITKDHFWGGYFPVRDPWFGINIINLDELDKTPSYFPFLTYEGTVLTGEKHKVTFTD